MRRMRCQIAAKRHRKLAWHTVPGLTSKHDRPERRDPVGAVSPGTLSPANFPASLRDDKNQSDNLDGRDRLNSTMKSKIFTVILLLAFFVTGCEHKSSSDSGKGPAPVKGSVKIDRKTFSMLLPDSWSEDTKDDMYDPDSFIFFENPESCLVCLIIGKKSAGFSVDKMLEKQKECYLKKITEAKISSFDEWSTYKGKGINISGKIQGAFRFNCHIFGFESDDTGCVVVECGMPVDLEKFSGDFETIRQNFKLK